MKKNFILGMSFLLIASALQIHSNTKYNYNIKGKYPYVAGWASQLPKKYPNAGFKDLVIVEKLSEEEIQDDIFLTYGSTQLCARVRINSQGKRLGGEVLTITPEFEFLEKLLAKQDATPESLTPNEILFIKRYNFFACHEAFHTITVTERKIYGHLEPTAKERFAILTPILLGNAIAQIRSQFLKSRPMHALAVSLVAGGALIAADIALTKIKTALDCLEEERNADLHAAQHVDRESFLMGIAAFKMKDFVAPPRDVWWPLLAQRESAHPLIKPVYAGLINAIKTATHYYYDDSEHPTYSARANYLADAFRSRFPEKVDSSGTIIKALDETLNKQIKAFYEEERQKEMPPFHPAVQTCINYFTAIN